jgi:hypothetical protein
MRSSGQQVTLRFFLSLGFILGLIGILTFVFVVVPIRNENRAIAIQTATESNKVVNKILEQHFSSLEKYVENFAQQAELRTHIENQNWAAMSEGLEKLVTSNNQIEISFISDAAGTNRVGYPVDNSVVGKNFAFRQWYKAVTAEGHTIISEVYRTATFPRPQVVAISTPIRNQDQKVIAFLTSLVKVETMASWIQEKIPHHDGGVSIFDHVGNLVAMTQNGSAEIRNLSFNPVIKKALKGQSGIFDGADPVSGITSLMSYSSVPNFKWNVIVSRPKSEAYAQFLTVLKTLLCTFTFLSFLIVLCYFFWRGHKTSEDNQAA